MRYSLNLWGDNMAANKKVRLVNRQGVSADKAISEKLKKNFNSVTSSLEKNVTTACIHLQSKEKVAISTTLFDNVASGGQKALVDTGRFLNSIDFDVKVRGIKVYGRVGSTISNPPYPEYLEFGTSRMSPKPTMGPTFRTEKENLKNIIKRGVKSGIKEGL